MANKAISELPQAQNVQNQDLFVLEQSGIAKKLAAETFITEQGIIDALAEALDGHGGIQSVTLSSVSGRIRTYLITFTDGSATTFQVLDGTSIDRIEKTSTAGLVDTYTIFMSDGTTSFFQVTNGSKGDTGDTGYPTDAQVTTAVTTWLDNNVTPGTGAVLDRTLTMSNAAAPADLVGDLKSELSPIVGTVDFSQIGSAGYYIDANNVWQVGYATYFVPVYSGQKLTLATTYRWGIVYAILKDNSVVVNQSPNFCTGYESRVLLSQNGTVEIVAPSDCKYIAVRLDNDTAVNATTLTIETPLWAYAKQNRELTNKIVTGTNTVYVAASNSTDNDKLLADYVCTGTNDEVTIQAAINSVYGVGTKNGTVVYLLAGDYYVDAFPNTNYDGHVAIMLPSHQSSDTIGTDVFAVSLLGVDYNTENVVIHVTDSAYNNMNVADFYSVIAAENDWYYNHYAIHDIRIYVPSAQKKIVCFDGRRMGSMDCRRLKAIALDHATWTTPTEDLVLPNVDSIGVAGACFDSNSWNYTWESIYSIGFGQGFAVAGEHLLALKCVALYGRYGFTFHANMDDAKVQQGNVPSHPNTLILCSDEANANFWLFGGGNTRRPVINCYDLSIEFWSQWFSLGGNYATEEDAGQFSGFISYALSGGDVTVPWWANGSGHNFTTVNLNQSKQTTEAIRKTYAPNMGQQVFDTTLNKLAICTEPWTKEWRDAMGNVLT